MFNKFNKLESSLVKNLATSFSSKPYSDVLFVSEGVNWVTTSIPTSAGSSGTILKGRPSPDSTWEARPASTTLRLATIPTQPSD